MGPELAEKKESLWALAAAPLIWAAHFVAAYGTAAVYCAKLPHVSFAPARVALAIMTGIALAAVALVGWRGWRRHRQGSGALPHDADSPEDRHRFLGFATALLSGLSALTILFEALAVALGSCR